MRRFRRTPNDSDVDSVKFRASKADRRAGRRHPLVVIGFSVPVLASTIYFLGWQTVLVVAVLTLAVVIPLALRYARAEDTSEVVLTEESVIWRRDSQTKTVLDRTSPALESTLFSDSHGLTTQLLLTDGSRHIRLVSGSWSPETLGELAAAVGPAPIVSTWSEVISTHRSVFPLWERRPGVLVLGSLLTVVAAVFVGILIAVFVFGLG